MNPPLISVVVPVYKVEAYLQECIDSILAQSFTDFELILVDDGSPDNSGSICDENATRDSRICVIHQENQGVTRARANGVAAARGEFINFVDSDDTIPPHSLATLAAHANEATDIVLGMYQGGRRPQAGEIPLDKYREITASASTINGCPYARLFRRSLFDNKTFDTPAHVKYGEDHVMNIHLAYKARGRIYNTDAVVYNYRDNPDGAATTCRTPECIAAYQTYRLAAIPPQDIENFLPLGLAKHLIDNWLAATLNRIRIPASTHDTLRYLIRIKKKHPDIRLGFLAGTLFYCTNPIVRAIVITIRTMINVIRGKS